MVNKKTKGLFWLNVKSTFNKLGGMVSLVMGGIFILFQNWVWVIILIPLGIFLLIIGGQQSLEYKRHSGYIVYND